MSELFRDDAVIFFKTLRSFLMVFDEYEGS